jgi:hypothetical protein
MAVWIVAVAIFLAGFAPAVNDFPLTMSLDASVQSGSTRIASRVSVQINRLMEESRRQRVTDALAHGGYGNFVNALRTLPAVGTIAVQSRTVEIRYAREEREAAGRRLILVADRPLFFLGDDRAKARTGYELTVLELRIDEQGAVTGRMAGAARVKPSPDGIVLDDYADAPVSLTGRLT